MEIKEINEKTNPFGNMRNLFYRQFLRKEEKLNNPNRGSKERPKI